MGYLNVREAEIESKVAKDYFGGFDCTRKIGNIDFCVTLEKQNKKQGQIFETESLLWAEAKKGTKGDIYSSFVQLILTIGKARTFDKNLPPAYIGAFDAEKIAFISYNEIHDIFYVNDFNWNVTPSNHETKEFKQVHKKVKATLESNSLIFFFDKDHKDLQTFIKLNFIVGKSDTSKIKIDKNNFMVVYNKWLSTVKPTIAVNWEIAKKNSIIDGDFYLADLLSIKNDSIKDKLSILLKLDHYILKEKEDELGELFRNIQFSDKQKAHTQFWNKYERPPKEEYWDYIVQRRDLLVPQDVRERKGSFFTPQIWVELSQRYLTDVLGEDWQDEYYIWDCAAGTGNLLAGLTNKYNIWASTLDTQDVDVMHERIETMNKNSVSGHGANILQDHVFKFDFLNDEFTKLPKGLQEIINNPKKRKKLVIYINPPYAEASDKKTLDGKKGKGGVEQSATNKKYAKLLGQGNAEIFAQFFIRIQQEIGGCVLGEFSTLKILQGQHFIDFRKNFLASLEKMFVVPADTFDNVKGKFPIGFMIWNTGKKETFESVITDVYDRDGNSLGQKKIVAYNDSQYINDWIKPFRAEKTDKGIIAKFPFKGNDFQNQNMIAIVHPDMVYNKEAGQFLINANNLIKACIYFAVRHCIEATWLNDRDQFLFPNDDWKTDIEFQNDCLAYALFSNNIQAEYGVNNWIPFTEQEVNAREKFDSNFMTEFMSGKVKIKQTADLFKEEKVSKSKKLEFSEEAKALFSAGKALWKYYHKQPNCNVNASWYDIREHFQGRNETGKMNNKSEDETYMKLIADVRDNLKIIARKIEPKIYEYGFLKV